MKNATILLAVVAVMAMGLSAYGAPLVDEDFATDPGWTSDGMATAPNFGWEVDAAKPGAQAITGTWERTGTRKRYYTDQADAGGSFQFTQNDSFSFTFDITITANPGSGGYGGVGLMNTGNADNKKNIFGVYGRDSGGPKLAFIVFDQNGGWDTFQSTGATLNTLYHCEVEYDGSGNGSAYIWATGPKPGAPTFTASSLGAFTLNAFGTYNYNDGPRPGESVDLTVDDMVLVPEPATMVLLGLGGIGVLLRRRRK